MIWIIDKQEFNSQFFWLTKNVRIEKFLYINFHRRYYRNYLIKWFQTTLNQFTFPYCLSISANCPKTARFPTSRTNCNYIREYHLFQFKRQNSISATETKRSDRIQDINQSLMIGLRWYFTLSFRKRMHNLKQFRMTCSVSLEHVPYYTQS